MIKKKKTKFINSTRHTTDIEKISEKKIFHQEKTKTLKERRNKLFIAEWGKRTWRKLNCNFSFNRQFSLFLLKIYISFLTIVMVHTRKSRYICDRTATRGEMNGKKIMKLFLLEHEMKKISNLLSIFSYIKFPFVINEERRLFGKTFF